MTGEFNPGIIPKPVAMTTEPGTFSPSAGARILVSDGAEEEAGNVAKRLWELTGLALGVSHCVDGPVAERGIVMKLEPALKAQLGDEGYRLSVRRDGIVVTAPAAAGLFHGGVTLAQLVFPGGQSGSGVAIPCVEITDYPRFAWRGLMLDSSRHYMPKRFIERLLDLMALQKMNRFHWHLVDSEAWRLEIRKYPKLVEVSEGSPPSFPSEDPNGREGPRKYQYGHFHGGGYYTQEDVREIVAYAAARHISVMPEIEFPGHSMAALAAYPEFSATGRAPVTKSNISPDLIGVDDRSLGFLREVLAEVMELFPGEFIHFGGDEAPKQQWKESPAAQGKIKELGLKDENALQSWLFEQMAEFVARQGRRAVGWQEITEGGIPKGAVVMPWKSLEPGIEAANGGNDIIIATVQPNYFDSYETDDPDEPAGYYKGVTLAAVYGQSFEYPGITPGARRHILGAQAQLWTELMPTPADVEYKAFPRSAALAEALWTPLGEKDFEDFTRRLAAMAKRWERYSPPVNYHGLGGRGKADQEIV